MLISYYIYHSLHVSGDYVPIIKRNNCIYVTLGSCYSVWMQGGMERNSISFHTAYYTVIHADNFWIFFDAIQMIHCRDWRPWTKPGYITMTRRQSNNQWNGGITSHHAPKNSECKNPLEKFSPRFFGIKTAFSSLIIFQRAKLSTQSITRLCWCN